MRRNKYDTGKGMERMKSALIAKASHLEKLVETGGKKWNARQDYSDIIRAAGSPNELRKIGRELDRTMDSENSMHTKR